MIRKDVYLTSEQASFLESQDLSLSEHIRRAIDDYIDKLKALKVSASKSKRGGDINEKESNTNN